MLEKIETEVIETENTNNDVEESQDDETKNAESTQEEEKDENDSEESANSEKSEEEEAEEVKPKKNGFKKRVDRLNRKISDREREIEYWKSEALKGKNQSQEKDDTSKKESIEDKPKTDDFESQEEYIEALTDWKLDKKFNAQEKSRKENEAKKAQMDLAGNWQSKINKFVEKTPDFEEVMEDAADVSFSTSTQEAIFDSELGPEILYELASKPDEADRISKLSGVAAIREIGKIEAKLQNSSKKTETKKTTSAPNPMTKTVKGSAKVTKNPDNMSMKEYEAWRNKNT